MPFNNPANSCCLDALSNNNLLNGGFDLWLDDQRPNLIPYRLLNGNMHRRIYYSNADCPVGKICGEIDDRGHCFAFIMTCKLEIVNEFNADVWNAIISEFSKVIFAGAFNSRLCRKWGLEPWMCEVTYAGGGYFNVFYIIKRPTMCYGVIIPTTINESNIRSYWNEVFNKYNKPANVDFSFEVRKSSGLGN